MKQCLMVYVQGIVQIFTQMTAAVAHEHKAVA